MKAERRKPLYTVDEFVPRVTILENYSFSRSLRTEGHSNPVVQQYSSVCVSKRAAVVCRLSCTCIHCSMVWSSQVMNRRVDEENVIDINIILCVLYVCICLISLSIIPRHFCHLWQHGLTWGHYVKWNKPDTKLDQLFKIHYT